MSHEDWMVGALLALNKREEIEQKLTIAIVPEEQKVPLVAEKEAKEKEEEAKNEALLTGDSSNLV